MLRLDEEAVEMSIIFQILLQALITFLTQLLSQYTSTTQITYPPPPETLEAGREKFVNSFTWKFWYGPSRMLLADKMYSAAMANYTTTVKVSDGAKGMDPKTLATQMTAGISPETI
jgi:hypothetical protein